jgi:predicted histone-like DNA-binding protein
MSIQFDFRPSPRTVTIDGEEVRPLYPKAVNVETISFDTLAKEIEASAGPTAADVKGVMEAIVTFAARHLTCSQHVELRGLGTLSLGIACDKDAEGHTPLITSPDQVKPSDLHVSRVNFDAKPEFLARLQTTFEPAVQKFPSNRDYAIPSPDERRALLRDYLTQNATINIRRYAALTHLPTTQATAELKAFAASGFLVPSGPATHRIYLLGNGEF